MKRIPILGLLAISLLLGLQPRSALAQSEETEVTRKVTNKVVPAYPELARSMRLTGTVKLQAQVLANGTVKSVQVTGGNPLLVKSAQNALNKWKWEKADCESTELVQFHFSPD